jgi:hypothetical protein
LTFHRSFHSQIEKLRQGRGSQRSGKRSGTHPRELRQGRLWSSGIMRACRLLVVRARRVRVILRCPTRDAPHHSVRAAARVRELVLLQRGSECSSESAVQRGIEATVQGRTWNLKPERGRETRARCPHPARTSQSHADRGRPQRAGATSRPQRTRGVAWELKARCAHCRLSVASRHASEDAYILISDCLPGMRPRVEAGARTATLNAPVLRDTATGCSALRTGLSAQLREPQDTGSQVHPAFPPWEAGCSHCMARRAQHTRYAPGAQVAAPPVALDQSPRQPPSRNDTRASLGAVPLVHVLLSAPMLLGLPPLGAALDGERSAPRSTRLTVTRWAPSYPSSLSLMQDSRHPGQAHRGARRPR